jgi:Fuc2NAc and GlcNAc transferase
MNIPISIASLSFAGSMIISGVMVALIRVWAERRALLDYPNERSSHMQPTAKGGGIAIVVLALAVLAVESRLPQTLPWSPRWFLAGGALIALISWIDDIHRLPVGVRLMAHVAAAIAAIATFGPLAEVDLSVAIPLRGAAVLLTILWIVGMTNAYNFMDGIDGIAGGQAIVGGLAWGWAGARVNQPWISVVGIVIAGAAAGFLLQNWQPAKIFMGDVGSAFLGFVFALLALAAARVDGRAFLFGALAVWPFIVDTCFTVIRRALRREDVLRAHRSHVYQRLTQVGWSHARVAVLYAMLSTLGVLAGAAVMRRTPGAVAGAIALVAISSALVWAAVVVAERKMPRAAVLRSAP